MLLCYSNRINNATESTMNQATQRELIIDEAIEQFNEDMSNACTTDDREHAVNFLATKVGHIAATRLFNDWMAQQEQAAREARQ